MRYMIREKFFRLGEDSTITNEAGQPIFEVDGKVLSLLLHLVLSRWRKSSENVEIYSHETYWQTSTWKGT